MQLTLKEKKCNIVEFFFPIKNPIIYPSLIDASISNNAATNVSNAQNIYFPNLPNVSCYTHKIPNA